MGAALLDVSLLETGPFLAQAKPNDILEGIIQIAFVALFFGVPIVRGILRERQRNAAPGAPARRAPRPVATEVDGELSGRDLWKQLLEGVEPTRPAAKVPRPQDPMGDPHLRPESAVHRRQRKQAKVATASATPEPARRVHEEPLTAVLPSAAREKLRDDLPSALRPMPSESELERTGGDEMVARGSLAELSGLRSSLPVSGTLDRFPPATERGPAAESGGKVASRYPLSDREAWRRAVVLAEVLGPPAALRELEGGALGRAGLL
ncbi:hypothetical protein Pla86_34960 [Planctomycetes bacterium Pla86]|uniref:Uncharacterized protein n=2 Tax=Engelhardtia mirabilis TaxID=2528011 RepID=A0A518BN47_9BACT|nr:hypothetical protein Pla133_34980 [Planctomycetes bacterium Pla133]QDV02727.1 hypothetical protein Pla86_34960 [Planctomycetes bacterium Pla86]